MSPRNAILRLFAVGVTSTAMLSFAGAASHAASFNLLYQFGDEINGKTTLSAVLEGEIDEDDQNVVTIDAIESVSLLNDEGTAIDFEPGDLAFEGVLTFDGSFAAISTQDLFSNGPSSTGFSLFNNLVFGGQNFSFADLVYQHSQGNNVIISQAFSSGAYSFSKVDIPENSSAAVMLTALAGMGLMVAKKHSGSKLA